MVLGVGMNNYKIRVNNEAESREAQELFKQLGFKLFEYHRVGMVAVNDGEIYPDVIGNWDEYEGEELTLPQLRDLVVLHRNDIDDANWETEGDDQIYEDSSGKSFIFREQGWDELQRHEMRQSMWEKTKPKPQTTEKEQGLISGADAKLEIKVPAPFEPKVGEEYYYPYPHSERGYALDVFKGGRITNQFGAWRKEAEIKIVVEQFRKLKELLQ